jgi:hypothetical protein
MSGRGFPAVAYGKDDLANSSVPLLLDGAVMMMPENLLACSK